jgi:hypothetical protein
LVQQKPLALPLSCLIHALAGRTFPAGERGSAAGSLLSSHYPNYTWACVMCRPSPELPFHFVWFLGWSTRHLALDPSSVLHLQHKLCSYLDACPFLCFLLHVCVRVCVCVLKGMEPPRGREALPHGSALHSPACTPSSIGRPPRPACIWPVRRGARLTLSLCKLCPGKISALPIEPHTLVTLVAALCLRLVISISRGRCAAVAPPPFYFIRSQFCPFRHI